MWKLRELHRGRLGLDTKGLVNQHEVSVHVHFCFSFFEGNLEMVFAWRIETEKFSSSFYVAIHWPIKNLHFVLWYHTGWSASFEIVKIERTVESELA